MREIRFQWWHTGRTCVIFFGSDFSFHDLWIEEVQAMVDELTLDSMAEGYRLPQPFVGRFNNDESWFSGYHQSRPGTTLTAYADFVWDDGEQMIWSVCYGGACATISVAEANQLVERWTTFIAAVPNEKVNWKLEGF